MSAEFTAILARLLTRQGNQVGAVPYDGINTLVVPPRGGRQQVLHLLDRIQLNPRLLHTPVTDISQFIGGAFGAIKRRSLVFVISDFISSPGWDKALAALNRKHEVLAVRLCDPLDSALPDIGMLQFEDAETGETVFVDTGDRGFRERYVAEAERNEQTLLTSFAAAGTDVLEISTEDDLVDAIRRFADLRKTQRTMSGGGTLPPHLLSGTNEGLRQ
jgi:uncharacterized protein (DUF58 family)